MEKNEMLCKAKQYDMYVDKDGNEQHCECRTLGGQNITGEGEYVAKTGDWPNWNYIVPFKEAMKQVENSWGFRLITGDTLKSSFGCTRYITRAYTHDYRRKYNELASGEVFYEFAIDKVTIENKTGKKYLERYKTVFTKI